MNSIINQYGWENFQRLSSAVSVPASGTIPARIISVYGSRYLTVTPGGFLEAGLSGRVSYGSQASDLPVTGDWVQLIEYENIGYITAVLPRYNAISRKAPGRSSEKQVMAANVDLAIVVQGLDRDFNLMRLDRYLVQLAGCKVPAIVVLNKADLVEDPSSMQASVRELNRNVPVVLCSIFSGLGMDEVRGLFQENRTYVLIGSSGVGKSTLINALMGGDHQRTEVTSTMTGKGKHTTTTRDLFRLPQGALIVDTPGMREFGLTADEGTTDREVFPAFAAFAGKCRYPDCRHTVESGCAVREAVQQGTISQTAYGSYLKLMKEQEHYSISAEEKKRKGKRSGKMAREATAFRKRFKY